MIEDLKNQYNDFTIKEHDTGWIEVITPFLDIHYDYISVYIKNGVISDDRDTLDDVSEHIKEHVGYYIQEESKWRLNLHKNTST